jgi:hypothetical protein
VRVSCTRLRTGGTGLLGQPGDEDPDDKERGQTPGPVRHRLGGGTGHVGGHQRSGQRAGDGGGQRGAGPPESAGCQDDREVEQVWKDRARAAGQVGHAPRGHQSDTDQDGCHHRRQPGRRLKHAPGALVTAPRGASRRSHVARPVRCNGDVTEISDAGGTRSSAAGPLTAPVCLRLVGRSAWSGHGGGVRRPMAGPQGRSSSVPDVGACAHRCHCWGSVEGRPSR